MPKNKLAKTPATSFLAQLAAALAPAGEVNIWHETRRRTQNSAEKPEYSHKKGA
ncbi:MAG: hypothetical protein JKY34_09640 [Kordiimonadaceae bacterium]|nr:hypothetical protein [Kordiimonadaceae bacterium]